MSIFNYIAPYSNGSGLLCDTHSVDAFVAACRWLRDHPQQWRAMREQARARVLQRFSLEAMVGRYVEVYDRLLKLR